jgi:hypothetical protein
VSETCSTAIGIETLYIELERGNQHEGLLFQKGLVSDNPN